MRNFRTYQLAKDLFRAVECIAWRSPQFKDQAHRATLSVALNLAEGYGRRTVADRKRFYHLALGSLREVQACLDLHGEDAVALQADRLGASLFRLIQNPGQLP